jgi:predicted AAA+ superfamily ATPase
MQYQYRTIESKLTQAAASHSLVGLKGPIGSGKTTLLVNLFPQHDYINFDDPRTLMRYREDPKRFLRQRLRDTIFDEAQHAPDLINELLKLNHECNYILASSCLFQGIRGIDTEKLSNIQMLTLLPYQFIEIPNQLREQSIFCGGFPALINKCFLQSDFWFANYIQQNLLKQLPTIGNVSDQYEFQRLLHLLAANTAKPLNMSYYANQLSVDVKTIKRWIEILAASFIIFLVPPYYESYGKRTMKSPKLYFYDTGLISYLTGIETQKQFEYGPLANAIFENHVVMEVLKKTLYESQPAQFYYYSTNHGVAVDLIIEQQEQRQMICICFNETFRLRMVQPIESFIQEDDQGYLIYNGVDIPYRNNIQVHNISTYLHSH